MNWMIWIWIDVEPLNYWKFNSYIYHSLSKLLHHLSTSSKVPYSIFPISFSFAVRYNNNLLLMHIVISFVIIFYFLCTNTKNKNTHTENLYLCSSIAIEGIIFLSPWKLVYQEILVLGKLPIGIIPTATESSFFPFFFSSLSFLHWHVIYLWILRVQISPYFIHQWI